MIRRVPARAMAKSLAAGLEDVAVLRGGTDGWHQRGLALSDRVTSAMRRKQRIRC
jgi:3-mercaptopyruvate sulfurtransferase SseA